MRYVSRLKFACANAVLEFCRRLPDQSLVAVELVAGLESLIEQTRCLLARHKAARQEWDAATEEREAVVGPLKERMCHLIRLAAVVAARERLPELRLKVQWSRTRRGSLLPAARAALAAAGRHEQLLLRAGMPPDMLAEVGSALDRYEAAQDRRTAAHVAQSAASADLHGLAQVAMHIVRHLDALNRMRFAGQPDLLAEWDGARTVRWNGEDREQLAG
jgi:hypothetical protein